MPQIILRRLRAFKELLNGLLLLGLASPLYAEVITDGTAGPARTLIGQPVAGGFSDFIINENLGTRAGANLFHSFERFNIASNEGAIFLGSPDIDNVISRVTGGQSSNINGLLFSNIGNQGFYFINPAGVMFGANAQIDVPASFYVSTANELRFNDGSIFSATNFDASTFNIDQPESFGFLGDQSAKINFTQSNIGLKPGSTLSISGGSLDIDDTRMSIDRGEIQLIGTGDTVTDVTITGELSAPAQGDLNIVNSFFDVTGDGAGRILIHGGATQINSSRIFADNNGITDASLEKGIYIQASSLEITSSDIITNTFGQGRLGANLSVTVAESLSVKSGGIVSRTFGIGNSGIVTVTVGNVLSLIDGVIGSNTFAAGSAGQVNVTADSISVDGQGSVLFTGIASNTSVGSGKAGAVTVDVDGAAMIVNGSEISSSTFGAGHADQVTVIAGSLTVDSQSSGIFTGITSQAGSNSSGNAGNVAVTVDDALSIVNGGLIGSSPFAAGHAGQVSVKVGSMTVDGQGSGLFTGVGSQTNTNSRGDAGKSIVTVDNTLLVVDGGVISSSTFGAGHSAEMSVSAGSLIVDGQSSGLFTGITSQAAPNSSGNAGMLSVTVDNVLSIVNGGQFSSGTFASGDAGKISVTADTLVVDGQASDFLTGITTLASINSSGQTGEIILDTQNLSIRNKGIISIETGPIVDTATLENIQPTEIIINTRNLTLTDSSISTQSLGNVPAGSITINVVDTLSLDPSFITTEAHNADGGDITINARIIDLLDSQITTSVSEQGSGGNISLNSDTIILDSGFIQANTAGADALGGDIKINTLGLIASRNLLLTDSDRRLTFQSGLNVIQAAAPDGVKGNINITSPELDISGDLSKIEAQLLDLNKLAKDPCTTLGGRQSRLTRLGRGSLPETPEDVGAMALDITHLLSLIQTRPEIQDNTSQSSNSPEEQGGHTIGCDAN